VADLTYQFRRGLWSGAETYTLTDDALISSSRELPLREVAAVRVYTVPGMRSFAYGRVFQPMRRCAIRGKDGRKIALSNLHFAGLGRFADQTESYLPFVRALVRRAAERAAGARLVSGMPPTMWWSWAVVFGALVLGLAAIVLLGAIGLIMEGQLSWGRFGFLLLFAGLAAGPVSFLRALWPLRSRPLDLNEI